MKLYSMFVVLALLSLIGCQKRSVQVTISYDREPINAYPYVAFSNTATIHYTIGADQFTKTVQNHQSIQVTIPEKTGLRATIEKTLSDSQGARTVTEDVFYTVDADHPTWKL